MAIDRGRIASGPFPAVDLSGYYVLPGIVDLHGRYLDPHRNRLPLRAALTQAEQTAAQAGITTGFMAQGWSWRGPAETPDACAAVLTGLAERTPLIDLRAALMVETHSTADTGALMDLVHSYRVGSVLFTDHLSRALAESETDPAGWAARSAHDDPSALLADLRLMHERRREVPRRLCRLAETFDQLGLCYGSHGDTDGETREVYSMIGAKICDLPRGHAAASLAKAVGDPVLLSADALLCQNGPLPVRALIRRGKCDALVSRDYAPALAAAAFALAEDDRLADAWALVSSRPAAIMRLHDRGDIASGKRADLCIVSKDSQQIEATLVAGRLVFACGEAARRFRVAEQSVRMAAE